MNVKRREDMVGILPKTRISMWYEKSHENRDTATYTTTTPDHNIQSTTQGMTQALYAGEHLCRMMDNDGSSPDWRV